MLGWSMKVEVIMPEWVEVGCYVGGRGDETPRVVLLGGREVAVRVERRWLEDPVGLGRQRAPPPDVPGPVGGCRRCRLAQELDGSWRFPFPGGPGGAGDCSSGEHRCGWLPDGSPPDHEGHGNFTEDGHGTTLQVSGCRPRGIG
jgi:hypothetical protein